MDAYIMLITNLEGTLTGPCLAIQTPSSGLRII